MSVRAALRRLFSRKTIGKDAVSGLVLGIEAVPDGLAAGLLAGLNPLAGLYAYLFGMVGATFFTSSTFMAVQATGAMALIVSDSDLQSRADPDRRRSSAGRRCVRVPRRAPTACPATPPRWGPAR